MRVLDQGPYRLPQDLRLELARNLEEVESQAAVKHVALVNGYCGGGPGGSFPPQGRMGSAACASFHSVAPV